MKFVHRLNVRALSAMVTGIMVASSMLASAGPIAAIAESSNTIELAFGRGLQGSTIRTDTGTFISTPGTIAYLWYRCPAYQVGRTNDTTPIDYDASCESTGVTRNTYTLTPADLAKPWLIAMVTRDGGDRHFSDAWVMKRKPALDTSGTPADHWPYIVSDDTTYAAAGISTLYGYVGDWVGEPAPSYWVYWLRCTSASASTSTSSSGCVAIPATEGGVDYLAPGSDYATYDPSTKDVGKFIRFRISAINQFATVKVVSPSWKGGYPSTASNDLNRVTGAPFSAAVTTGTISVSGRKANPGTWTFYPAKDTSYGWTYNPGPAATASDATPGFSYQWYTCQNEITVYDKTVQANSEAAWNLINKDGAANPICTVLPGETNRTLGAAYGNWWFVVKVTAQNIWGWQGSSWSKTFFIRY